MLPKRYYTTVNTQARPVLGLQACLGRWQMQLVGSVDKPLPGASHPMLTELQDVFNGIELFPGEHRIHVDKSFKVCCSCSP